MNILICSAGRRVKLIKYFKEELSKIGGKVITTDCDYTAPALHQADIGEIVPPINDPLYIDKIKELCKKHDINAVLSLIDPELTLLAENKEEFSKENILVLVSEKDIVDICFDKYLTYQFLEKNDLPAVPVYESLVKAVTDIENNKLQFPLIVKPRTGSASIGVTKVNSMDELAPIFNQIDDLIIQPFMEGDEYGVDCYIDLLNKQPIDIFCKRKIKMRSGETDKSIAINDPNLIELIERVLKALSPVGPIDIDCFKTGSGYVISEINPRFGGGYLHAHESGRNFVKNIINNLQGVPNETQIGTYEAGSVMIKFDDVLLLKT